jgi:hypothetical protein
MSRYATLEETLAIFEGVDGQPQTLIAESTVPRVTAWGEAIEGEEYRLYSWRTPGAEPDHVQAWLAFAGDDWDYVRLEDAQAYRLATPT